MHSCNDILPMQRGLSPSDRLTGPVRPPIRDILSNNMPCPQHELSPDSISIYWTSKKLKISVTGAGGFIAAHLAKRLKSEGHYIVASDWKRNEHFEVRDCGLPPRNGKMHAEEQFCDEFHLVDLRVFENCKKVCDGCDHVFNLAADMGGMGFIQSNHSVIMYNNTMVSFNMLEAARQTNIQRFFYASSACIYPEGLQLNTEVDGGGLKEASAWPAQVCQRSQCSTAHVFVDSPLSVRQQFFASAFLPNFKAAHSDHLA
eukprot:40555-Chlamydomonas_euryale.AAC.9